MKYEGSEIIVLPTSISIDVVKNRIESWLKTKIGSRYKTRKMDSNEFILKRTWVDTWCQLCLIFVFIGSILDLVIMSTIATFGVLLIDSIVIIFFIVFPSRVIIHVHVHDSNVNLKLESTHKEVAEQDFDSLIDEIKSESTKPLETLH